MGSLLRVTVWKWKQAVRLELQDDIWLRKKSESQEVIL